MRVPQFHGTGEKPRTFPSGSLYNNKGGRKGRLWIRKLQDYWSRRFKVGRSSSFLSPSLDEPVVEARRKVGLLGLVSSGLCRFSMAASRALMSLNSEVVSMYCSRGA